MRRDPKPAKSREAKPPVTRKSPKDDGAKVRDLEKRLAEALRAEREASEKLQIRDSELVEATQQQIATSEILRVMSRSPATIGGVLDTITANAVRVCNAYDALLFLREGELMRRVAHHGPVRLAAPEVVPLSRARQSGAVILDGRVVHLVDAQVDPEFPETRELARAVDMRTALGVPLLREEKAIGALIIRRQELLPFTGPQIALLQTFADQAVIAIENVRLFTELETRNRELTTALEQQTATSDILRVISGSQMDVQPVFETIAANAARLCEAFWGAVFRFDGEMIHLAAHHNIEGDELAALTRVFPIPPGRGSVTARAISSRAIVHVEDVTQDPEQQYIGLGQVGFRTILSVPMLREGLPIGTINAGRKVVKPFSADQIALLQTFADQAVIAIENVRLFNETKDALDRQTATAEILRVIASSPTDLQPVLEAVAERAARLCGANDAVIFSVDGDVRRQVAHFGSIPVAVAPEIGVGRGPVAGRAIRERRTVHIHDILEEMAREEYEPLLQRDITFRTILATPLLREDTAIGVIVIRRTEVRPFTDTQIALLETFADQAVIAIENVRLFTELQEKNQALTQAHAQVSESLEQQTATSEILRVISSSPTDLQPVFDAIVESAARLCQAAFGVLHRFDGQALTFEAQHGMREAQLEPARHSFPQPVGRHMAVGRAVLDRRVAHIHDIREDNEYLVRSFQEDYRTVLAVPLMRKGAPVGALGLWRREVQPFSDQQIELVKTFADQAVIAIENVRLFTELQEKNVALTTAHAQVSESLDQQTATSEILRVISQSQTDVQPVFDAIVRSAVRLCHAAFGGLHRVEGDLNTLAALYNLPEDEAAMVRGLFPRPIDRASISGRAMLERRVIHIHDIREDPEYSAAMRDPQAAKGYRTQVSVPMLREGIPIGAINLWHHEVQPFTEKQIEVLQTFADQAVIAIENVRLFKELQTSNHELTESLAQQTATAEILRVISRSQTDVQPVFDTIVTSAVKLCDGLFGTLWQFDGELIHQVAQHNYTPEALDEMRRVYPCRPSRAHGSARAILERAIVHIPDTELDPEFRVQALSRAVGWRSGVFVPMLREGAPIGAIAVSRARPGPFSDTEIELLKTFADQAIIAIENARLFKELEARTQDLTRSVGELRALGDVGQAISSTLDLRTVLSTIVARATELSGTDAGVIYEYDEPREVFVPRATEHLEPQIVETMLATPVRKGEGATGRLAELQEPIQVLDILAAPGESRVRGALVRAGYKALLAVPLVREGHLIGGLTVIRKTTGAFPPGIIELLTTFATQSVLAIQNARLFREIEEKSRQLEVASQHKSEFLANMSHELRTPLNAIIGFSEVLSERMFGELNEKQEEYSKDIHASGEHLLSLINDILDLSKIEAGRMELELSDFHLPTALDSALTLVRERAGRRSIALHLSVDERLGQMLADERKVRQVVLNLLSNAIKFTPDGGRIDVGAVAKDGFVEVSVSDTGVGIAPEDQEAVFEEFCQVGTADKKVEGTGLGLTLCRKFVELHGGKIWVKSQVGEGATFTFTLPVRHGE